jgi:RNA polymerase sigma-70 factor (ECF subfamily)
MTDRELINQILNRDKHALHYFYVTYTPKLTIHIANRVENAKDAEEILQDTLYAFLEAIRDFAGKSSVRTFLFSIAGHKIIDYYRRKKLKQLVFSQIPQLELLVSPLLSPEDEMEVAMLKRKINRTLEAILPQYRTAILFKYMDNLPVVDIARRLSVTVKSAESILFRARKAFVKAFVSI